VQKSVEALPRVGFIDGDCDGFGVHAGSEFMEAVGKAGGAGPRRRIR
jgi:hypothetical protein